jgi:hypothetical protein
MTNNESQSRDAIRKGRIRALRAEGTEWFTRAAEIMESDPEISIGRAKAQAHEEIAKRMDEEWRASATEAPAAKPFTPARGSDAIYWGEDPETLKIVGLD